MVGSLPNFVGLPWQGRALKVLVATVSFFPTVGSRWCCAGGVSHIRRLRLSDRIFFVTVNLHRQVHPLLCFEYRLLIEALEGARRRLGFLLLHLNPVRKGLVSKPEQRRCRAITISHSTERPWGLVRFRLITSAFQRSTGRDLAEQPHGQKGTDRGYPRPFGAPSPRQTGTERPGAALPTCGNVSLKSNHPATVAMLRGGAVPSDRHPTRIRSRYALRIGRSGHPCRCYSAEPSGGLGRKGDWRCHRLAGCPVTGP